jgi:hypothetical protein
MPLMRLMLSNEAASRGEDKKLSTVEILVQNTFAANHEGAQELVGVALVTA